MVTAAVLAAACFLWLLWSGMIPNGRTDRETGFSGPVSINMAVSQLNAAYKDRLADLQMGIIMRSNSRAKALTGTQS